MLCSKSRKLFLVKEVMPVQEDTEKNIMLIDDSNLWQQCVFISFLRQCQMKHQIIQWR